MPELDKTIPPSGKLSSNLMGVWLQHDTNRNKTLEKGEVVDMIANICGKIPSPHLVKKIFDSWGIEDELTWSKFQEILPRSANEKDVYNLVMKIDRSTAVTEQVKSSLKRMETPPVSPRVAQVSSKRMPATSTPPRKKRLPQSRFTAPQVVSSNTLQLWLRFDPSRKKVMEEDKVVEMLTAILGGKPTTHMVDRIFKAWEIEERTLTWPDFRRLFGNDSNEANVYRDLDRIIFGFGSAKSRFLKDAPSPAEPPSLSLKVKTNDGTNFSSEVAQVTSPVSLRGKLRMSNQLRAQFPLEGLRLSKMMNVFSFAYRRFYPGEILSKRRADLARKELASARKSRYSFSEFCDWFVKIMEIQDDLSSSSSVSSSDMGGGSISSSEEEVKRTTAFPRKRAPALQRPVGSPVRSRANSRKRAPVSIQKRAPTSPRDVKLLELSELKADRRARARFQDSDTKRRGMCRISELTSLIQWIHKMSQSDLKLNHLQTMLEKKMKGRPLSYPEFCDVYVQAVGDLQSVKSFSPKGTVKNAESRKQLSVNSMKMWLKYDVNRSKVLEEPEMKQCVEDCLGKVVDRKFMSTFFKRWKVRDRTVTFEIWMKHLPGSSNEETFRQYLQGLYGYE